MSADPFCPRHGRASRPVEVPGLRCDCRSDRGRIYQEIDDERSRQQRLFGDQSIAGDLPRDTKLRVLVEEVGEVARAIDVLEAALRIGDVNIPAFRKHLRSELVQVAACAVGWLESS
jgi:NTP pyrophosphatase (non-canonical NTP hydrolase)